MDCSSSPVAEDVLVPGAPEPHCRARGTGADAVGRGDEASGEWLAFVCRRRVGTGFDLAELSASAV